MASPKDEDKMELTWQRLSDGLKNIYSNNVTRSEYLQLYTLVYDYCSETDHGLSNLQLYINLTSFLREHNEAKYKKSADLIDEPLLLTYAELWNDYRFASKVFDGVCSYFNRQWVNRQREKRRRIDVLDTYQLAAVSWKDYFLENLKKRMCKGLLNLIAKERNGETVNAKLIKTALDSFIEIGINTAHPLANQDSLLLYKEAFEKPFLAETETFYATESASFIRANPVSEFMKKIETWFNEETRRAKSYFHESTMEVLMQILEHFLLIKYMDLFLVEFRPLLACNKIDDLKRMYQLLSRLLDGLDKLKTEFQEYVTADGLLAIEKLHSDGKDHESYINAILDIHRKYNCILLTSFESEAGFVAAFDKACESFINKNSLTESSGSSNKSAEFLARYIDQLFKKRSTGSEEDETMEKLNRSMVIFKYIEEKDMFESYYSKLLAKRLVQQMNVSSNDDAENTMISNMRNICGYEYASKLQRMVTDVIVSRDLNEQFANETGDLDIDFSISVISSSSWPFSPSSTMTLPHELEQSVQQFTSFYNTRFSGRRLTWLYGMSRGELISRCFEQKYTFQVTTLQMAILLQFNNGATLSIHQLEESTGIKSEVLLQMLQVLVRFKLLKKVDDSPITETSSIALNESYRNRKMKVNINAPMKSEVKKEQESVDRHVREARKFIIQAAIVRIAKDRKKIKHQILVMEVLNQLSSKFKPHIPDIKKTIELLIEKEYLKRAEGEEDTYCYVA